MNSPLHPDPTLTYAASEREAAASNYAPSVPISVYRELAAELKATKARVDSLNGQNQQLMQQNQVLRQEILRFAQAADQLRQAIEPTVLAPLAVSPETAHEELYQQESESLSDRMGDSVSNLAAQMTRIVKAPTAQAPARRPQPRSKKPQLFTEQRPERLQSSSDGSRSQEMSGLWLATTILLIVVSAFGAGFLIMKPLLGGGK